MPAAATIVLADATPANHSYEPIEGDSSNFLFLERTLSTTSAGAEALRLTFSRATSGRSTNRVGVRLDIPYEHTVDGVTLVHSTARYQGSFTLPETMTASDREHFMTLVANAYANAVIRGYVEDLIPVS